MRDGGPPGTAKRTSSSSTRTTVILVLEVKSGTPSRDHAGRWWIGGRELDSDPCTQATQSISRRSRMSAGSRVIPTVRVSSEAKAVQPVLTSDRNGGETNGVTRAGGAGITC